MAGCRCNPGGCKDCVCVKGKRKCTSACRCTLRCCNVFNRILKGNYGKNPMDAFLRPQQRLPASTNAVADVGANAVAAAGANAAAGQAEPIQQQVVENVAAGANAAAGQAESIQHVVENAAADANAADSSDDDDVRPRKRATVYAGLIIGDESDSELPSSVVQTKKPRATTVTESSKPTAKEASSPPLLAEQLVTEPVSSPEATAEEAAARTPLSNSDNLQPTSTLPEKRFQADGKENALQETKKSRTEAKDVSFSATTNEAPISKPASSVNLPEEKEKSAVTKEKEEQPAASFEEPAASSEEPAASPEKPSLLELQLDFKKKNVEQQKVAITEEVNTSIARLSEPCPVKINALAITDDQMYMRLDLTVGGKLADMYELDRKAVVEKQLYEAGLISSFRSFRITTHTASALKKVRGTFAKTGCY